MTATDELRRLLDERGVEWRDDSSIYGTRRTVWTADGVTYVAAEVSGRLKVSGYLTPEQAVEATLGRGTCRVVSSMDMTDVYEYAPTSYWHFEMTCGGVFDWTEPEPPSFCPCCGRKVVDA